MNQSKELENKVEKLEKKVDNYVKKTDELYKEVIEDGKNPNGIKVTCDKCGYSWRSKSQSRWVSCPKCGGKTKTAVSNEEIVNRVIKKVTEENKKFKSNIKEILNGRKNVR